MKFMDEYRDKDAAAKIAAQIRRTVRRPWTLMEVCGGQTHTILKSGLLDLLPEEINLVHGPGCPVCVTPLEQIDKAVALALRPGTIFCSFGDMLRVPGSRKSLFDAKAEGGDVRIVYSPADAVKIAAANPEREVVFFAVGFETTAPANAMSAWQAARMGLKNFSLLVAHVLVPPAMEALLSSSNCRVQAFLAPGHVCTVVGFEDYERVVARAQDSGGDHGVRAAGFAGRHPAGGGAIGEGRGAAGEPVQPGGAARGATSRRARSWKTCSRWRTGSGAGSARFPGAG